MDKAKTKVTTISERISRFITNANKTCKEKRDEAFLKARLHLLNNYWQQYSEAYENLIDSIDEKTIKSDEFFTADTYSKVECEYIEALSWVNKQLEAFQAPREELAENEANLFHSTVRSPSTSQVIKLPKIQLPSFNGSFLDWPSFYDTYLSLIHENCSLSDVQKMHYLKSAITGDASKLLKHFSITSANYNSAWDLIVARYENKRVLVNTNLHELIVLPGMSSETPNELRRVLDRFNQAVRALENLSRPVNTWDDWLVYFLTNKLDASTRKDWETSLASSKDVPAFTSLQIFLENRLQALSALSETKSAVSTHTGQKSKAHSRTSNSYAHHTQHASSAPVCMCCRQKHFILFCPKFKAKSVDERIAFLNSKKICTNCLRQSHTVEACTSVKRCQKCNKQHHTMIHKLAPDSAAQSIVSSQATTSLAPAKDNQQDTVNSSTISHVSNNKNSSVLLATAVVLIQSSDGRLFRIRALLDQGSESSFITEGLAKILCLRKQRANISVLGVGQCEAGIVQAVVTHNIVSSIDSAIKYCVQSLVLPKLTHLIPSKTVIHEDWPHIMGLPLADPDFDKPSGIDLILGADVYSRVLKAGVRHGPIGTPVAQNTTLGWILSGKIESDSAKQTATISLHTSTSELNTLFQKFWETEEPPKATIYTPDEAECEAIYANTHYRDARGRYIVKLPFKSNHPTLGNSRDAALSSLLRMEKRFSRDHTLFSEYSDFIKEYLSLSHMELVQDETKDPENCYYLPHHAVLKPSSTTTKLRVVFNASKTTSTGCSLNDCLHIGPKLQNDVLLILTRWRFYPHVYTADIAKMFRQILVDRSDTDFQRILWRSSINEPVQCYRLLTVTYGTACAPYLACKTLQQLATDHKEQFGKASKILLQNFYVDDALFGAFQVEEAIELRTELNNLLLQGGFKLRKWLSNSVQLLDGIPLEDRELTSPVKMVSDSQIKALGLIWSPTLDCFKFNIQLSTSTVATKRSVLADISRLYDPCGWLSPVTITAKIFLQALWKHQLDWDEELPSELKTEWFCFKQQLQDLNDLKIPRWIGLKGPSEKLELHGFCDASQAAYGAAVYLRIRHDIANVEVRLLASKTRVSPIRTVSLPRLELCGAALLAELLPYLQTNLGLSDVPVHTWTDSTIVLAWLRAHPSRWKVYVANRVSLVQENLSNAEWHHIPSGDNPADCITRGIPASELQRFKLWWQGPAWLTLSSDHWPVSELPLSNEEIDESSTRTNCISLSSASANPMTDDFLTALLHRYSDLMKLFRITALCFRLYYNCKPKSTVHNSGLLKTDEINMASDVLIRLVQHRHFSSEIKLLTKDKTATLPSNSKLRMLNPKLDDKLLLRVGGRLKHALLSEDEKYPLILPADSRLTHLVIAFSHMKTLHGGTQATLQNARTKFWILNGRNKVRQFIRRCVVCSRFRATSRAPLMGDLPVDRLRPAKPFLHSGVDFAGPFVVKLMKGRCRMQTKTYVACFICFVTRAIHLELVMDLSAEAFVAAFRRFVSRRGHCARIYSDNGRNFVAADKQLSQHLQQLINEANIPRLTLKDGTEWHFIPPYSPHFGGLWEAGVKSMKHHFKRVVGNHLISIEEMLTLLAQIEACLNSRPLQAISDDPSDLTALTPGHFLVGENLLAVPEPSLLDVTSNRLNRWQMVQHMYQNFWNRWYKEYLYNLQLRYKWQHPSDPIKINNLVLIKEDNLPPQCWLLGRIVALHPGADGQVRVATVRHKDGYFKRPVIKLCVLPINTEETQSEANVI